MRHIIDAVRMLSAFCIKPMFQDIKKKKTWEDHKKRKMENVAVKHSAHKKRSNNRHNNMSGCKI